MARARLPILALVGWTLFLWLSRLRNVLADDDLSSAGRAVRVGVVVLFALLAAAVIAALRSGRPPLATAVRVLAGWTVAFWAVRGTAIALDDHSAGFIAIHVVLMAISIGLAVWAWRSLSLAADDRENVRSG